VMGKVLLRYVRFLLVLLGDIASLYVSSRLIDDYVSFCRL
jgi:hypothetical protein